MIPDCVTGDPDREIGSNINHSMSRSRASQIREEWATNRSGWIKFGQRDSLALSGRCVTSRSIAFGGRCIAVQRPRPRNSRCGGSLREPSKKPAYFPLRSYPLPSPPSLVLPLVTWHGKVHCDARLESTCERTMNTGYRKSDLRGLSFVSSAESRS